MVQRRTISANIQYTVRERAKYLCEFCHTSELWQYVCFTIDHIIPLSRNGTNDLDNLALACFHCNRRKSSHTSTINPLTQQTVSLFHPRKHAWNTHFVWSSDKLYVVGLTAIGQATIELLELNRERVLRIRAADIVATRHPPEDDNIRTE